MVVYGLHFLSRLIKTDYYNNLNDYKERITICLIVHISVFLAVLFLLLERMFT